MTITRSNANSHRLRVAKTTILLISAVFVAMQTGDPAVLKPQIIIHKIAKPQNHKATNHKTSNQKYTNQKPETRNCKPSQALQQSSQQQLSTIRGRGRGRGGSSCHSPTTSSPCCLAGGRAEIDGGALRDASRVTRHASLINHQTSTSQVTRHTSHVTRHTSHVTRHTSSSCRFFLSTEAAQPIC
jgi:hypothetical protein